MESTSTQVHPDFFLIGAAKSGTTSLAKHLDSDPQVFVCKPKEPNFFAFPANTRPTCVGPASEEALYEKLLQYSVTSPMEYGKLFDEAQQGQRTCDASVRYLYEPSSAARIAEHAPAAKAIALLREPAERMYSHYHMNVRNGLEPLTFAEALHAEDERIDAGWGWDWHYRRVSTYAEQIERYFSVLGQQNVLVLFHDDLKHRPAELWATVCRFLGIDSSSLPDFNERSLVGTAPRSRWLRDLVWNDSPLKRFARSVLPRGVRHAATQRVNRANVGRVAPLPPQLAADLRGGFRAENAKLTELLGRQLPW